MSKFKVGDKVRILPTATQAKYENMNTVGWDIDMGKLVGGVHTIECIYQPDRVYIGHYMWLQEDIELAQGLEEGDFVDGAELTDARFRYMNDRAKELGIKLHPTPTAKGDVIYVDDYTEGMVITRAMHDSANGGKKKKRIPFMEFISRMENNMERKLKVTELAGKNKYSVDIKSGRVKIGCYDIDFGTVRDIYECTKPADHVKVKGSSPKFNDVDRYAQFGGAHRVSYDDIAAIYNLINNK